MGWAAVLGCWLALALCIAGAWWQDRQTGTYNLAFVGFGMVFCFAGMAVAASGALS
jgi:hypothetical protein